MCVHVIHSVLRVVFNHENGAVFPDGTVRNLLDDLAQREIVVGDKRGLIWIAVLRPHVRSMVVRQPDYRQCRGLSFFHAAIHVLRELLVAELIGDA